MKKILLFATMVCIGICDANGVVRDKNTINRTPAPQASNSVENRAATTNVRQRDTSDTTARSNNVTRRQQNTSRNTVQTRNATRTNSRSTSTSVRSAIPTRTNVSRAATTNARTTTSSGRNTTSGTTSARAAATRATKTSVATQTFGGEYNTCRDAYFTCMDQFCAKQNETYRRCACSSRLTDIQNRERALSQGTTQLQDFKDLNIDVINKTANEVGAMLTTTTGEAAATNANDKSDSEKQLAGISAILSGAKNKALSTSGTLDIAGDISAIWSTTDFTGASNIANLTGESLYNAVNAQCVDLVAPSCNSQTTLNMVISAYGMYIENDCSAVLGALDKQLTAANKSIRDTEREMTTARLENYNAHNATSINDCIAQVRQDLTSNTACGPDYVHCLDITGKYLSYDTGEPIYSADFYQLNHQLTLSGDILTTPTNQAIIERLNAMRTYAERGLDTCRDISESVWTEFMRQAIVEIYQGQQSRIRQVKDECLDVVVKCYDEETRQLKDFSNIKEQLLLGQRLELSEDMCRVKLDTCSNLYGDGSDGMAQLLTTLHKITDQKIGKACRVTLAEYAREICAAPLTDTLHTYPYGCRVYAPGDAMYAEYPRCNIASTEQSTWADWPDKTTQDNKNTEATLDPTTLLQIPEKYFEMCRAKIEYKWCRKGYYLADEEGYATTKENGQDINNKNQIPSGYQCAPCKRNHTCAGGTNPPSLVTNSDTLLKDINTSTSICGTDYIGSLYQKLVQYAMEFCVRPSDTEDETYILPPDILNDVTAVMDTVRADMGAELAKECQRLGGIWVPQYYTGDDELLNDFYDATGANKKWGYCKVDPAATTTTE